MSALDKVYTVKRTSGQIGRSQIENQPRSGGGLSGVVRYKTAARFVSGQIDRSERKLAARRKNFLRQCGISVGYFCGNLFAAVFFDLCKGVTAALFAAVFFAAMWDKCGINFAATFLRQLFAAAIGLDFERPDALEYDRLFKLGLRANLKKRSGRCQSAAFFVPGVGPLTK